MPIIARKTPKFSLIFGNQTNNFNKYVSGAGVGALNSSVKRALNRKASVCDSNCRSSTQDQLITQDQLTAHDARAFVLSCMDFRLIDDMVMYMDNKGYNNNYDKFILAGASYGYNQDTFPAWKEVANTHIELAIELHNISEIIVIDHMKCGAYKIFSGNKTLTEEEEYILHVENLNKFEETIKARFQNLIVKKLLMKINGEVDEL